MKTRVLGTMTVSAIGLGGMPMSIEGRPERSRSIETIHAALDAGITLIDTADVVRVGRVDQGDPRVQGSVDRLDRATSLRTALDRHGHPTQPDRRHRHRPKNTSLHVSNLPTSGERKPLTPPRKTIGVWHGLVRVRRDDDSHTRDFGTLLAYVARPDCAGIFCTKCGGVVAGLRGRSWSP